MGRRRKNFDFFKKISSRFKLSKRQRQKLVTLGVVAVVIFAFWVYHTSQTQQTRRVSAKKTISKWRKPSAPAKQIPKKTPPKAEPYVYYKRIPSTSPASPVRTLPAPQKLSGAPKLVFVIDDMGNTNSHISEIKKLGNQVTYAILPLLAHSGSFAELSLSTGAEVILHLPLESYKGTIPGPGLITTSMSDDYVLEELRRNLASVPHRIGVNNHMGSKGTSDPRLMDIILSELKNQHLLFLDSRTTSQSVAPLVAQELGLPILRRDEFLDNEDNVAAIRVEVQKLAAKARRKGYAIGIGHYRLNTLKVLQEEIPKLKKEGFQIVSLREILNYKKS